MIKIIRFHINLSINLTSVYNYCYEDLLQAEMAKLDIDEANWWGFATCSSMSVYYSASLTYTKYGTDSDEKHYIKFIYHSGTVNSVSAYISFIFFNRNHIEFNEDNVKN